jgi:K+-sensing histidine kinase KdpD
LNRLAWPTSDNLLHLGHFPQDITSQIRESQKEADRDLWEQQNTEKQNIMTVAALFMAGAFALAVEGQLPANTGNLMILPFIAVVDAYYFMLAFCISMVSYSIFKYSPKQNSITFLFSDAHCCSSSLASLLECLLFGAWLCSC